MKIFLMIALSSVSASAAPCSPKVERVLARWDQEYQRMVGQAPIGKLALRPWVRKKLAHMVKMDQAVREWSGTPGKLHWNDLDSRCFFQAFSGRWERVDQQNTEDLKRILGRHYWFVRSRWGARPDRQGWLLVQHADRDRDFQIKMKKRLHLLYLRGETLPAHYAYLEDRVAAAWSFPSLRRPQRYGTQGQCVGPGKWEPLPLLDPTQVDVWRGEMGLEPMAEYIKKFETVCR